MKYYKAIIDANNLMESHLLTSFFGTDSYDFFEVRLENRSTARYFFNKNTSANEDLLTDSWLPNCEQIGKLLSCHDRVVCFLHIPHTCNVKVCFVVSRYENDRSRIFKNLDSIGDWSMHRILHSRFPIYLEESCDCSVLSATRFLQINRSHCDIPRLLTLATPFLEEELAFILIDFQFEDVVNELGPTVANCTKVNDDYYMINAKDCDSRSLQILSKRDSFTVLQRRDCEDYFQKMNSGLDFEEILFGYDFAIASNAFDGHNYYIHTRIQKILDQLIVRFAIELWL